MSNLRINVHGRFYDITCDKSKEKYVLQLSKQFSERVNKLSLKVKNVDHPRLLVLTGILLCEELEKMQKDNVKIDNPYGKNYKKDLEDLKQKNAEKTSLIKDKIHNLINHFQSLNK